MLDSTLYLVPTPIGNLGDITLRALEVLRQVDIILAEDTRQTGKLLKHYEIRKPMQSYHAHNEHQVVDKLVERLAQGETMALVSDAGTPAISDPGFLLVRAAHVAGIKLECLPGATAFVPALVKSGLPADKFVFEGFLPHKKGRKTRLNLLAEEERSIIFYESPYRLLKTLEQCAEVFGANRLASVSREISKIYEETQNGSLASLITHFNLHKPKGEFVVVIGGKTQSVAKEEDQGIK
ncbi:MAG: 16S rRNA (cytidine(1402)-2'-O)-methyltransferase [Bernardetiaceae bacterium]|nr:16S rRNA (cytidine(1402)-2'-O)-methyltransferase [Bernardetiaceae bacterium]